MGEMAGGRSKSVRSMTGDSIITANVGDGGGYGDKAGVRLPSGSDSGLGTDGVMWSTTRLAKRLTKTKQKTHGIFLVKLPQHLS